MTILEPPYDKAEADFLRKHARAQIWACWWCLTYGPYQLKQYYEKRGETDLQTKRKVYWPSEMLVPIGHRFACPKHLQEQEALRKEIKA